MAPARTNCSAARAQTPLAPQSGSVSRRCYLRGEGSEGVDTGWGGVKVQPHRVKEDRPLHIHASPTPSNPTDLLAPFSGHASMRRGRAELNEAFLELAQLFSLGWGYFGRTTPTLVPTPQPSATLAALRA